MIKIGKNRVHEFLNEMWNTKSSEVEDLHGIFSSNVIAQSPLGKKLGREGMQTTNIHWSQAFPDMALSNISIETYSNTVVAEWTSTGTHENVFNSKPPTGRKIQYQGVTVFCFQNNQVAYYLCSINLLPIYEQLGYYMASETYDEQRILHSNYDLLAQRLSKPFSECEHLTSRELTTRRNFTRPEEDCITTL